MSNNILFFTGDVLFYLLLKSHVEFLNPEIVCDKVTNFRTFDQDITDQTVLLVVDSKMFDISAIELVNFIRCTYKLTTPIWFFSEIKKIQYLNKALDVGANKVIRKPFEPLEVAHEIVAFVNSRLSLLAH